VSVTSLSLTKRLCHETHRRLIRKGRTRNGGTGRPLLPGRSCQPASTFQLGIRIRCGRSDVKGWPIGNSPSWILDVSHRSFSAACSTAFLFLLEGCAIDSRSLLFARMDILVRGPTGSYADCPRPQPGGERGTSRSAPESKPKCSTFATFRCASLIKPCRSLPTSFS